MFLCRKRAKGFFVFPLYKTGKACYNIWAYKACTGGSMDRASDSGSEGWGFESLPVYQTVQIRTFYQLAKGSDLLFLLHIPLKSKQSKVMRPCSVLFSWHLALLSIWRMTPCLLQIRKRRLGPGVSTGPFPESHNPEFWSGVSLL